MPRSYVRAGSEPHTTPRLNSPAPAGTLFRAADGSLRTPWRILGFFFVAATFYLFAAAIAQSVSLETVPRSTARLLLAAALQLVPVVLATYLMMRAEKLPPSFAALGRDALRPAPLAIGTAAGTFGIAIPIGLLLAIGWLRFANAPEGSWIAAGASLALFLAPSALAEELLLRGYAFAALRARWGARAAVAVSSITFGMLHAGNPGATSRTIALVTLAGIFLGVVLVATSSLYAATAAHFFWNWVMAAVFHTRVSGWPFPTPDYRMVDAGPDWATGGAWGPEGGVLAGVAMVAGIAFLARGWWNEPTPVEPTVTTTT